ncbi:hypothetical protein C8Q79DRAFT_1118313 [Trametes meyenii]|nr:hypothetical protein C8Q79DRAFT_1118313 [Trametes meyenii]
MIVYPLALIATLLLTALSNLSATLFAPSAVHFNIPLVSVAPYDTHSFDRLLLSSAPSLFLDYDTCPAPLATATCRWAHSSAIAPSASAIVDISSAELALRPSPLAPSAPRPRRQPPPTPALGFTPPALRVSCFGRLVDGSVVCCYLALLYWLVVGTAQVTCYFWYRVGFAVDVQRMESPWTLYSVGLFSETSVVSRYGAPGLLEYNLARVPRTARFLRPVRPALPSPPSPSPPRPPPPPPQPRKEPHRGRRGGKREQRRRRTQEHVAKMAAIAARLQSTVVELPPQHRPTIWDCPVDVQSDDNDFATDGSGRVISSTGTLTPFLVDPPTRAPQSTSAPFRVSSTRSPFSVHQPQLPSAPMPTIILPPKNIVGRTHSHCDTPPKIPAIPTLRRRQSPGPTLGTVAVRVVPAGRPSQRVRRALAVNRLGHVLNAV